jgi:hypothetical protein
LLRSVTWPPAPFEVKRPTIVIARMPRTIAPGTLRATRSAVRTMPARQSAAGPFVKSPGPDEGLGVRHDDAPVLQADEGDEEADAAGDRDLQAERDRRDDLLAHPGDRQGEEDDPVYEHHPERLVPGKPLPGRS